MPRKSKEPTPNYELMFQSTVCALQSVYAKYKKYKSEELRWTFFGNDGRFAVLDGYEVRRKRVEEAEEEIARLIKEVERLREHIKESE